MTKLEEAELESVLTILRGLASRMKASGSLQRSDEGSHRIERTYHAKATDGETVLDVKLRYSGAEITISYDGPSPEGFDTQPTPKTVTISLSPTVPCGFLLTCSDGRTAISTLDHEFPGVAQNFGWSLYAVRWEGSRCRHVDTDGSFDCPNCGLPVSVMIDEARNYLTDNCPITVPDPGFFA